MNPQVSVSKFVRGEKLGRENIYDNLYYFERDKLNVAFPFLLKNCLPM